jgi:biotin transport system substrate-specific component
VIYAAGAFVLYLNLNFLAGKEATLGQVLELGVIPFMAGDILKMLGTAALASRVGARLRQVTKGPGGT